MPRLALALWAVYYALAVFLRVALHLRRTGTSGLVLGRGRSGPAQWCGEGLELLGLALALAAPLLARTVPPLPALDRPALHVVGIALFVASLAGIIAAQHAMGASWRIGVDPDARTALVQHGPFRLVRNPIFTCIVAVVAGSALLVPSPIAFAAVVLTVVSVEIQARLVEEPHLRALHGHTYAEYAGRAGRFVPLIGRRRAGTD